MAGKRRGQIIRRPIQIRRMGRQIIGWTIKIRRMGRQIIRWPIQIRRMGRQIIRWPIQIRRMGRQIIRRPIQIRRMGRQIIRWTDGNGGEWFGSWAWLRSTDTGIMASRCWGPILLVDSISLALTLPAKQFEELAERIIIKCLESILQKDRPTEQLAVFFIALNRAHADYIVVPTDRTRYRNFLFSKTGEFVLLLQLAYYVCFDLFYLLIGEIALLKFNIVNLRRQRIPTFAENRVAIGPHVGFIFPQVSETFGYRHGLCRRRISSEGLLRCVLA